jgi:hypothetical protein
MTELTVIMTCVALSLSLLPSIHHHCRRAATVVATSWNDGETRELEAHCRILSMRQI